MPAPNPLAIETPASNRGLLGRNSAAPALLTRLTAPSHAPRRKPLPSPLGSVSPAAHALIRPRIGLVASSTLFAREKSAPSTRAAARSTTAPPAWTPLLIALSRLGNCPCTARLRTPTLAIPACLARLPTPLAVSLINEPLYSALAKPRTIPANFDASVFRGRLAPELARAPGL